MATPVDMPQLGNTVEECILTRWLRHEGDVVSAGDMIAEIETDKTTFEVTTPVDGTVIATFFEEGALVPVFTHIFVVGEPGESVEAFRPGSPEARVPGSPDARVPGGPEARLGRRSAEREGGGPGGPGEETGTLNISGGPQTDMLSVPISPRAARFAAAHGMDTAGIIGSGPGGRVLEHDLRHRRRQKNTEGGHGGLTGLRGTIARRMRESLATTAQYTLNSSADATALLAARATFKTSAAPDVTINDLVAFCTVQALRESPDINALFIDGRIVAQTSVHLAFAVDTPKGLLAPVARDAHTLTVSGLAARMKELANAAMAGTIAPDDLTGATFTISNLGSLGIESFTPLINPPQVAILGVDAIQLRPVRTGGQIAFVDTIGLSLTCDHQVIDGAPGARFLRVLADKIASYPGYRSLGS